MYIMFSGFTLIRNINFLIGCYIAESLWGLQPNELTLHYDLDSLVA